MKRGDAPERTADGSWIQAVFAIWDENVSLQRVADAAEVGVATLYNYYQTKVKLVIAISGKIWGDLWKEILKKRDRRYLNHSRRISTLSFIRTRSSGFTGNARKYSGS